MENERWDTSGELAEKDRVGFTANCLHGIVDGLALKHRERESPEAERDRVLDGLRHLLLIAITFLGHAAAWAPGNRVMSALRDKTDAPTT